MKKLTIDEVKPAIDAVKGYKLLSEEYINSKSKLKIWHSCGNVFMMTWNDFNDGHRCKKCADIKKGLDIRLLFETVEKKINAVTGYKLLSKEYITSKSKLKIWHSCGDIFEMSWLNFSHGHRCPKCSKTQLKGKESPYYKHDKTDEEREHDRSNVSNKEWRKAVYERDDFTCQKCLDNTGGNLEAHHILPYALFPKYRVNVENGITLCEGCHKGYHSVYGKGLDCNLDTLSDHLYSSTRYPSDRQNSFIENHQNLNHENINS